MADRKSSGVKQNASIPQPNILRIPPRRDVDRVLQSFNTWAFKREQPSDVALLSKFVERAVLRREPLSFVLYWGKGPRSTVEGYELQCLDYLASLADRVSDAYHGGASMKLVMTDTHAELNGHAKENVARYFGEVAEAASQRNFTCYLLADLCAAAAPHIGSVEEELPTGETLENLARSAMRWYRGDGTPEQGARRYYAMNMVERRVIEHFFPSSIFVTFNGNELRPLFPKRLPIFYMYSLKRGTAVKPWFLPDPAAENAVKLAG